MKKMCGRDQIKDEKILEAYDKYKSYLSELKVYEECRRGLNGVNIFKLVDLYRKNGFDVKNKKELMPRFEAFSSGIEKIKIKNPEANLTDISTQAGRDIVSSAIRETRGR